MANGVGGVFDFLSAMGGTVENVAGAVTGSTAAEAQADVAQAQVQLAQEEARKTAILVGGGIVALVLVTWAMSRGARR